MRRRAWIVGLLALAGCGRYGDFELPRPAGQADLRYRWRIEPRPVLERGPAGAWDAVDVLNPAVIRFGGGLLNLYSGFDGKTWHTGLALSDDGTVWRRKGKILSPRSDTWEQGYIAANGSALAEPSRIRYWYQAGDPPRIGLAESADLEHWNRRADPVLNPGPVGSWDERGVADPYVILAGGRYVLFYLGMDRAGRQQLGIAVSNDGVAWTKLRSNPVLELGEDGAFDENGLGEPALWTAGGHYWMLYTGRDRHERRRIGAAWSADGVRWERTDRIPLFEGAGDWNRAVVCDPTVITDGDRVRVWFGGGDQPRPDERLNGMIGYAVLEPVR